SVDIISSEHQPHPAVDDAAAERRPGIDGPAAVRGAARPHERLVAALPDIPQVLRVDEEMDPPEASLREHAELEIAAPGPAVRILLQRLPGGVVDLDADASALLLLPYRVQAGRVPGRQGNLAPARALGIHLGRAPVPV